VTRSRAQAGVESVRDTLLAITAVGMCKLVFLLISSQLFDRLGRRPMLLASAAGLTMSLLILSFASQGLGRGDGGGARPALAIFGLCAYMASFSIGFSPLVYVICSELFPLGVRARAMSCALFATRVTAGAISSSFVSMRAALTPAGAWLVFVPIALGAFCFTYAFIPETRGLGLEDVQRMFEDLGAAKIATAGGKGGGGGACGGGRGCAIGLRRRRPGTRDVEATPAQQLSTHEDEDDDSIATWREVERSISRNHVELAARGAAVAALPVPGDAGAY
jgi:MFS family permease